MLLQNKTNAVLSRIRPMCHSAEMELRAVCCLLITCLLYTSSADKEFFTSIGQMTDLLYMEKDLVTSLKDYIRARRASWIRSKSGLRSWMCCHPRPFRTRRDF
ncbi:hypothetical protein UPYG_G00137980 [Umbra pygmaea]|uniref:Uncharacterized protein n=1 Tax=Umbra pygmaea TaxID=75934 RepID=A0ABD0WW22_UMBPY